MKLEKIDRSIYLIYAITTFICMGPYFIWSTYRNGLFSKLNIIFIVLNIIMLFFFLLIHKGKVNKKIPFTQVITFFLFWLYQVTTGVTDKISFTLGGLTYVVTICIFLCIDESGKRKIFNIFSWIFALSLISGIVFSICSLVGLNIKNDIILSTHSGKVLSGAYYKHYFGSVFITGETWNKSIIRMSGMFDEPGVVGTMTALLLAGDGYKLKGNIKNKILLVAGIMSFSFAFIVMTLIYMVIKYFNKGIIKISAFAIILFICFNFMMKMDSDNPLINKYVKNKFRIENKNIAGNNRTSDQFDFEFSRFLNNDNLTIKMFGYGKDATINNPDLVGSYSYKVIIYNYGIFGFLFLIAWLSMSSLKTVKENKECLFLFIVFITSIYQRPDVTQIQYILVLFGGYANLKYNNLNSKKYEISD